MHACCQTGSPGRSARTRHVDSSAALPPALGSVGGLAVAWRMRSVRAVKGPTEVGPYHRIHCWASIGFPGSRLVVERAAIGGLDVFGA